MTRRHPHTALAGIALAFTLAVGVPPPAVAADAPARHFATPEAAIDALLEASREHKAGALEPLIGKDGESLFHSHDPVADQHGHSRFSTAYDQAHHLEFETPARAILVVGTEEWPMPVPLEHTKDGWQFDVRAGAQEILNRRLGRNELDVIEVCREFVLAEHEYAAMHAAGAPAQFARYLISHASQHDGLYWPAGAAGSPKSPLGPLVAAAAVGEDDATHAKPQPYHGYFFRVLTQQGRHAPGGAQNYLVDGHLTGGFALLAYPARYGETGVMSFLVSQSGIVREKNLGPDTAEVVRPLDAYDPDSSWRAARPIVRTAKP